MENQFVKLVTSNTYRITSRKLKKEAVCSRVWHMVHASHLAYIRTWARTLPEDSLLTSLRYLASNLSRNFEEPLLHLILHPGPDRDPVID